MKAHGEKDFWQDLERARREQEREAEEVAKAEEAAKPAPPLELTRQNDEKIRGRGRPEGTKVSASNVSRAERMGVSEPTVRRHDQVVETAEAFPFMQTNWREAQILEARKLLKNWLESQTAQPG